MARFDFIEASSQGYGFVWKYKDYLLKIIIPILFIKIACFLCVFVFNLEQNYLHQGLVLMPGFFVEAIFIARLIRFQLYGEPIYIWGKPVMPPKLQHDIIPYRSVYSRQQSVHACIALFMIVKVVQTGIVGGFMDFSALYVAENPNADVSGSPASNAAVMLSFLVLFIWVFRYIWIYIPVAMGMRPIQYIKSGLTLESSILMVLTWLICTLPLLVMFGIILSITIGEMPEENAVRIFVSAVTQATAETIISAVQVVALAIGIQEMLGMTKNKN